jgi:branched-chain amino acid aminotransferase
VPTAFVIDGVVVPEAAAVVSVLDRGFLYGDGVYEVARTAGGRPVDLERHLDRLEGSAARLLFPPLPRPAIAAAVAAGIAASGEPECYVRVVVTRGAGPIGLDVALADRVRVVVIAAPLVLPSAAQYAGGVAVALVGIERTSARALDPAVKSGNYLNNILGLAEAKRRGAYEALLLNPAGQLAEGSTSNVFLGTGGRLVTPELGAGILAGVTRRRLLELAREVGVAIDERAVAPGELATCDEAFLSSSIRGVLPIATLDGRALAAPGPATRRMIAAYDGFLAAVAGADPAAAR